ncbi:hypothetical protein ACFL54_08140, partial [Planctomycetota bacterium]
PLPQSGFWKHDHVHHQIIQPVFIILIAISLLRLFRENNKIIRRAMLALGVLSALSYLGCIIYLWKCGWGAYLL